MKNFLSLLFVSVFALSACVEAPVDEPVEDEEEEVEELVYDGCEELVDFEDYEAAKEKVAVAFPSFGEIDDVGSICELEDGSELVGFLHYTNEQPGVSMVAHLDAEGEVINSSSEFEKDCPVIGESSAPIVKSVEDNVAKVVCGGGDGPIMVMFKYDLDLADFSVKKTGEDRTEHINVEEESYEGDGFIRVNSPSDGQKFDSGPVVFTGEVSPNVEEIKVEVTVGKGAKVDSYILQNFKPGDTEFTYRAAPEYDNLVPGDLTYSFEGKMADGTIEKTMVLIDYSPAVASVTGCFDPWDQGWDAYVAWRNKVGGLLYMESSAYDVGTVCNLEDGKKVITFVNSANLKPAIILVNAAENKVLKQTVDFNCRPVGDISAPEHRSYDSERIYFACYGGDVGYMAEDKFYLDLHTFKTTDQGSTDSHVDDF